MIFFLISLFPLPWKTVDGKWSDWGDWSTCSLPCGGGTQDRLRTCTNPPPAFGGAQCTGESNEIRSCNSQPCPGKKAMLIQYLLPLI